MRIDKSRMSVAEVATGYFELAESILQAMIDSTLRKNLPVVFVLNRPFYHACFKGMWMCLAENPSDVPDKLLELGNAIDAVIEERFQSWYDPFPNQGGIARYSALLNSPVLKQLSDDGKVKQSKLIERLNNDVHGGLPSLEYYQQVVQHGYSLNSAKELCVVGHNLLYLNLRFAMSKRFPDGPVRPGSLLADPFGQEILAIYDLRG
ncbi:MAG: hypothetical protein ACYDA9_10605 [Terriglobia bacterium]